MKPFLGVFHCKISYPYLLNHGAYKRSHSRRIGNLKNIYVGAHQRASRQTYIEAQMYRQSSNVWLESIHLRMVHTSEHQCLNMHSDVWLRLYTPVKSNQYHKNTENANRHTLEYEYQTFKIWIHLNIEHLLVR